MTDQETRDYRELLQPSRTGPTLTLQSKRGRIALRYSNHIKRLPAAALIEVGNDHRLADQEPLEAILRECGG